MQDQATVRFQIPKDAWIGLGFLALAGAYWVKAGQIPISPLDGVVNAAAMPKLFATALMIFSALLVLRAVVIEALFVRAARQANLAQAPKRESDGIKFTPREHLRAVGVLLFGLMYLILLPYLGYALAVSILIAGLAVYMGTKPAPMVLAVAGAAAVIFYVLFVRILAIPLPAGFWPRLMG
jgi:putative tricarboxylic transport membrane protein